MLSPNCDSKLTLSTHCLQVIEFSSNDEQLSKVIANLGRVTTSYVFPMLSCAEGPGLSRAKVGHKSTFTVIAKDRNGEPCTTGKNEITKQNVWRTGKVISFHQNTELSGSSK